MKTTARPKQTNAIQIIGHQVFSTTPADSCGAQPASNDCGEELTCRTGREEAQLTNRHGFELLDGVAALGDKTTEAAHRHAVEPAVDLGGPLSGHLQHALADVQTDDPPGSALGDLDRVVPGSASEVEDDLVGAIAPDPRPQQHLELAAVAIRGAGAQVASGRAAAEPPEELIAEPSADHAHWSVRISGSPRSPKAMRSPASSRTSPTGPPLASITDDTAAAAARRPATGRSRVSTRRGRVVTVE